MDLGQLSFVRFELRLWSEKHGQPEFIQRFEWRLWRSARTANRARRNPQGVRRRCSCPQADRIRPALRALQDLLRGRSSGMPDLQEPAAGFAQRPLPTSAPAGTVTDPEQLEKERDRFLNEFNSQVIVSPLRPTLLPPRRHCIHVENHASAPEPASICQGCYDRLQERTDVLEAAMHMELKEAAQIIYDAVWADPSDPSKTYRSACPGVTRRTAPPFGRDECVWAAAAGNELGVGSRFWITPFAHRWCYSPASITPARL